MPHCRIESSHRAEISDACSNPGLRSSTIMRVPLEFLNEYGWRPSVAAVVVVASPTGRESAGFDTALRMLATPQWLLVADVIYAQGRERGEADRLVELARVTVCPATSSVSASGAV